MQSLALADHLFADVNEGIKTATILAGRRDIELGPLVMNSICGPMAARVNITDVRHKKFKDITDEES